MNLEQSIYSLLGSLVSPTAWQGSEKRAQMIGISGLKYAGSSAQLGPDGLWERTYQDCLAQTLDGFSAPSFATWTRWGTVSAGVYTGLARSAPRTSVNESSWWPTYLASEAEHGGPNQRASSGKPTLTAMARATWPTPTAIDSGSGRVNKSDSPAASVRPTLAMMARKDLWPTPQGDNVNGARNFKPDGSKYRQSGTYGPTLIDAIQHWPTPAAQDARNATLPPSQQDRDTLPGARLRQAVRWPTPNTGDANGGASTQTNQVQLCYVAAPQPGQNLNPAWVETLMGFPVGWTDVGPQVLTPRSRRGSRRAQSQGERSPIEQTG